MECFFVDWSKPFSVDVAERQKEATKIGVYAIYAKKGKTGQLLYIGHTYSQNFAKRLKQHRREWLDKTFGTKLIRFGTVTSRKGPRITYERVRDVEEFLIHLYRPPHNVIGRKYYKGRGILLLNIGDIGSLDKVASDDEEMLKLLKKAFSK